jgi:hypothetical protein
MEDFDDSTVYTFLKTRKVCIGSLMIIFTSHISYVYSSMCPKLSTYVKFMNENTQSLEKAKSLTSSTHLHAFYLWHKPEL